MDNIFSAYHYACKTKADKEAVEQIYKEVKKSAQNAIFRNIGDIFFTARTDTEINGAVECNGGTYSTTDFEGKQNVGNLLANGSLPYVTLSEYESLVSANGSCRAFGWDGGESFRVPTIPALLLTKEQSAVVGNGMTLGLTDGTNFVGLNGNRYAQSASYGLVPSEGYGVEVGTTGAGSAGLSNNVYAGITTDATKSGIVANLDVIEYRAMVQLANGATDQAVITATSALQQVANKVDKTSATDRETVVSWGMPDYSAGIQLTVGQSVNIPVDCVLAVKPKWVDYINATITVNGVNVYNARSATNSAVATSYILISKNSTLNSSGSIDTLIYYPLKGAN